MHFRHAENGLCQQNGQHVCNTGSCYADSNIPQQRDLFLQHQLSHKVSHACTKKGTDHFHRTAAQQKGKCTARNCGCQSQIPSLIIRRLFLNFVQHQMNLLDGDLRCHFRKFPHKGFQSVQLIRIHTGSRQCDRMGICAAFLIASELNGQQTNICRTGNAQRSGNLIHRIPHTPRTGSHRKHHLSDSAYQRRLFL